MRIIIGSYMNTCMYMYMYMYIVYICWRDTRRIKIHCFRSLLLLPTAWPPAGGGGMSPQGSLDGINPRGPLTEMTLHGSSHPSIDTLSRIKLECRGKL